MQKAESYEQISALVSAQFRRGVMTNNFLTEIEYRREIDSKALSYYAWEGGLLVFIHREGYSRLYYHLSDIEKPCKVKPLDTVALEIPHKSGRLDAAFDYWKGFGFEKKLGRVRLCRKKPLESINLDGFEIRAAKANEAEQIHSLLNECFDRLTGCLPKIGEVQSAPEDYICAFDDRSRLQGLLHYTKSGNVTEIRHLAVAENCRSKGVASLLLNRLHDKVGSKKYLVWTGEDNKAALSLYEKHGYEPDGWTSTVLIREYGGKPIG